ncbi:MAG: sigma-70 family RNA polymerase sigma factor [Pirellulaceae bacterium]
MALSEIDRNLLQRCLSRAPRSWEDFVDRYLGLVVHVVNHSAQSRSIRLSNEDREDLCAEVFLAILENDYAILRNFRGESSLATYLTVIARRVTVRLLHGRKTTAPINQSVPQPASNAGERRIEDTEEVHRLLDELSGREADVVRMYHLEGKTYQEISHNVGIPENSIGPTLSRAREKMRRATHVD